MFDKQNLPANNSAICRQWKKEEAKNSISPVPSCPCSYTQALTDKRLHMNETTSCAELVSPTANGYSVVCNFNMTFFFRFANKRAINQMAKSH